MASTKTITVPVNGMHCASCAQVINRTLRKVKGVEKVESYYGTEEAVITYETALTSPQQLSQQLQPLGYSLDLTVSSDQVPDGEQHPSHQQHHDHAAVPESSEVESEQRQAEFGLPVALFVFAAMTWEILARQVTWVPVLPFPEPLWMMVQFILATVMLVGLGQVFLAAVWLFLRYRKANMDTLVGIGTLAAYFYSVVGLFFPSVFLSYQLPLQLYFDVVIVVIGFVKYGKFLEARSKRRTGEALRSLLALQAKAAWVKVGEAFVEKAIEHVTVGDLVQVKPGSTIPLDGVVLEGHSAVNESMISGEPLPIEKHVGDQVIGGTLNEQGVLIVRVTKVGEETVLAHIIQLVKQAQNSKAPIERIADQVSSVFVPVVLVIAICTLVGWWLVGPAIVPGTQAIAYGISNMIAVLVIACPCALGLATPTAIIVGVGRAAKHGILIKNAESLEQLQRVDTIVFDKTGTLTIGHPTVQQFHAFSEHRAQYVWQLLAALEAASEHPLAQAVVEYARQQGVAKLPKVSEFKNLPGQGVTGKVDKQQYWVGNLALVKAHFSHTFQPPALAPGESLLIIFTKKEVLAAVTVADQLKENSKTAISDLTRLGIRPMMLSGDRSEAARYFAEQVGIREVKGDVTPADKLAFIRELQKQGKVVAMVGDGVNDAPALAAANVGIAMSTGTDVAITTAQATILKGDLSKVVTAFQLSQSVMRTIKQNLFWAFGYNVLGIPLAAGLLYPFFGVLLSPVFAGMAMAFSSVSVVLNSLRLQLQFKD